MAEIRVIERPVAAATLPQRAGLRAWRLIPLAFYVVVLLLIQGDLAQRDLTNLSLHLYFGALTLYLAAMLAFFAYFSYRRDGLRWLGAVLAVSGVAVHLAGITTRGMADGHYPLANMYEYTSMLGMVAVSVFLAMSVRYPVAWFAGGPVLLLVAVLMGVGFVLYEPPVGLVPALQSYWLKIHVTSMMTASGILVSSFAFAALYLVKERSASLRSFLHGSGFALNLPSLETLDRLTYRAVLVGFPIWTFGTMAGAIWGEHAWGRWWGWDPKETWAAITWMIYAIYLHAHSLRAWRGRRTALIATAGFVSILITLYAVNLWIVGLHSYARGSG